MSEYILDLRKLSGIVRCFRSVRALLLSIPRAAYSCRSGAITDFGAMRAVPWSLMRKLKKRQCANFLKKRDFLRTSLNFSVFFGKNPALYLSERRRGLKY